MVGVEGRLVRFEFLRPSAAEVRVVGDFPADVACVTMQRRDSGHWTAAVELPPGTYRFRYEADGQWFNDYAAFGLDHGPFGLESVVRVKESASSRSRPLSSAGLAPARFGKHLRRGGLRGRRMAG